MTIKFGWIQSKVDDRDHAFHDLHPRLGMVPPKVDLRETGFLPHVYDQGSLGSCTANAIAAAIQFDQGKQSLPSVMPSRLFIYFWERMLEGSVDQDAGAEIRDGFKVLNQYGYPSEAHWPYVESKFAISPPADVITEAVKDVVTLYGSLNQSLNDLKDALAQGFPIVFGIIAYSGIQSDVANRTGVVPMPASFDTSIGGHAIMLVGYDDSTQRFCFRNSWSSGWGDHGYGYLPYEYVTNPNLASDFWVVRQVVG